MSFPWIHILLCHFCHKSDTSFLHLCSSQGKEIIEFYLKELEDEGISHVPRWTPSSLPLPLPRPTSLSTSPLVLPKLAVTPAVSVPLPTDTKDSTSQDAKQDGSALQADSLTEILAGTPEGLFLQTIEKWETALFACLIHNSENLCTCTKVALWQLQQNTECKKDEFHSKGNESKASLFIWRACIFESKMRKYLVKLILIGLELTQKFLTYYGVLVSLKVYTTFEVFCVLCCR